MSDERDFWDKSDIVSKWLIPIAITVATLAFNSAANERAAKEKTLEVAIGILQAPGSEQTASLRAWALSVFTKETGLSDKAVDELQKGTQLPSTTQLQLPVAGQLRVSIIRLEGSSSAGSEQIKSSLIDDGYSSVIMLERPSVAFPDKPEVRFYYPADSQNAQALSDYINQALSVRTQVSDKSHDPSALGHRPGDLHIYIR